MLANRNQFGLGAERWRALQALDAPVQQLPRLPQLLRTSFTGKLSTPIYNQLIAIK